MTNEITVYATPHVLTDMAGLFFIFCKIAASKCSLPYWLIFGAGQIKPECIYDPTKKVNQ